jgi:hypothetical protein
MPGISSADMKVPTRARATFTPRPSASPSMGVHEGEWALPPNQNGRKTKNVGV